MSELLDIVRRQALRFEASNAIADDMQWLINHADNSFVWLSTQRDLVEFVHLAWQASSFADPMGKPMTRMALARRAFAIVGQPVPPKLSPIVAQLQQRQSEEHSIVRRYMASGARRGFIKQLMRPKGPCGDFADEFAEQCNPGPGRTKRAIKNINQH